MLCYFLILYLNTILSYCAQSSPYILGGRLLSVAVGRVISARSKRTKRIFVLLGFIYPFSFPM